MLLLYLKRDLSKNELDKKHFLNYKIDIIYLKYISGKQYPIVHEDVAILFCLAF
jgi:hypothetical protein